MSTERPTPPAAPRPSRLAVTKLLVELEAKRKHAMRYWLLALLAPLLLGAGLLVYTAYAVYSRLERLKDLDRQIAEKEATITEKEGIIAKRDAAIANNNLALEGMNRVISDAYKSSNDPKVKEEIINNIEADSAVAATTPRVYIYYPDARQKERVTRLASSIQRLGYIITKTEPREGLESKVLYFYPEDSAAAEKVKDALEDQGVDFDSTSRVVEQRIAPKAKRGLIEVWLPSPPVAAAAAPAPARQPAGKQAAAQPAARRTQTQPARNSNARPESTQRNTNARPRSTQRNSNRPAVRSPRP